jgi:hypothetical protein
MSEKLGARMLRAAWVSNANRPTRTKPRSPKVSRSVIIRQSDRVLLHAQEVLERERAVLRAQNSVRDTAHPLEFYIDPRPFYGPAFGFGAF